MLNKELTGSLLAVAMFVAVCSVGCGSGDVVGEAVNKANPNNVARVANAYGMFQMRTKGNRGPKDQAELKAFMEDPQWADLIAGMGIDDTEAVFTSERDDQPIKVRWGVQGSSRGCYEPVAFEAEGSDGSRIVGFCNGVQEEVDDETTYDEMFAGDYKPDTDRTDEGGIPKFDNKGQPIK